MLAIASALATARSQASLANNRPLDGLTDEQAQAVRHGPGVLLIVAGPAPGNRQLWKATRPGGLPFTPTAYRLPGAFGSE
jgi:hypothetical protein